MPAPLPWPAVVRLSGSELRCSGSQLAKLDGAHCPFQKQNQKQASWCQLRPLCRLLRFLRVYRLVMSLLRNGVYATLVIEVRVCLVLRG